MLLLLLGFAYSCQRLQGLRDYRLDLGFLRWQRRWGAFEVACVVVEVRHRLFVLALNYESDVLDVARIGNDIAVGTANMDLCAVVGDADAQDCWTASERRALVVGRCCCCCCCVNS